MLFRIGLVDCPGEARVQLIDVRMWSIKKGEVFQTPIPFFWDAGGFFKLVLVLLAAAVQRVGAFRKRDCCNTDK